MREGSKGVGRDIDSEEVVAVEEEVAEEEASFSDAVRRSINPRPNPLRLLTVLAPALGVDAAVAGAVGVSGMFLVVVDGREEMDGVVEGFEFDDDDARFNLLLVEEADDFTASCDEEDVSA